MSNKKMEHNEILLVGDVRYTETAGTVDSSKVSSAPWEFIDQLQDLMERHSIAKIDVAWDGLKIIRNFSGDA